MEGEAGVSDAPKFKRRRVVDPRTGVVGAETFILSVCGDVAEIVEKAGDDAYDELLDNELLDNELLKWND